MIAAPLAPPARLATALALALAGCPAPDDACTPTWAVELDEAGGPLLAGWGTAADDVWLVGGGLGASGARVVRWTGQPREAAAALGIDRPETLWWVWGSPRGTIWLVGERGLVLRGDKAGGFTPLTTGTEATLYGVWGTGDDDVWIVGGVADGAAQPDDDLVLHWDGATLTRVGVAARGAALFKVWGASADDVWVSGQSGTLWHRRGGVRGTWDDHAIATGAGILTVHGCAADDVYAVGGRHVWRWDGAGWTDLPDLPSFALAAGVACGADEVLVVGAQGLRLRRDRATGTWIDDGLSPFVDGDLHGAWIAPDGTLFAAGGDYLAPTADRRGVIARRTCR